MRTSIVRGMLALALLASTPPALAGVNFGGDLGISMTRNDQWNGSAHNGSTLWWFSGSLHLDASLFSPGTLDLGATASYLGYRAVGGAASDAFNYGLRLTALAHTPLNISASANRSTVDFTTDSNTGRVGSSTSDALGATVTFSPSSYPFLSATFRNVESVNRTAGTPEVRSSSSGVNAEASQSIEGFNYTLSYNTDWSSGDFVETNYQDHGALLRAQAQLATNVTAQVMATYNLREPTLVAPSNPRIDNQTLATWVQFTTPGDTTGGGGYSYASSLFDAPGSPLRQSTSHAASVYATRRLSQEFALDVTVGASSSQSVIGSVDLRATGESIGAGLNWSRQLAVYALQASTGGSVGLFQPNGAPRSASWGVNANANASRPIDTWYGNAGLAVSYDENTGAAGGTRARLYGVLGAAGTPLGWSFTSLLTGGFSHSESPGFGKSDQSNIRLDATANRSGYGLVLNLGLTDDLSEVLVPGAPPATALIPVDFNTKTTFATASAIIPTVPNLFLTLVGRYLRISPPFRDEVWEAGLSVAATYYVGMFNFSLYDQVSIGGSGGISYGTQNVLFLSVSRSFGR